MANASETEVFGNITEDTTWTLANSPYIVTGTIQVYATLTIEPGVEIRFNQSAGLNIGGKLNATGTENQRIIFTSNTENPSVGDWKEIRFLNSATDALFDNNENYLSGSIIKYSQIEYVYSAIIAESSSPYIENNIIRYGKRGVFLSESSSIIKNNTIYDIIFSQLDLNGNLGWGVFSWESAPIIINNEIRNCSGGYSGGGSLLTNNIIKDNPVGINEWSSVIQQNTITNNGIGIIGNGGTVSKNNISQNKTGILTGQYKYLELSVNENNIFDNTDYNIKVRTSANIDASNNYWGMADSSSIANKIYDYYDDISLGKVNYIPYATAELDFDDQNAPVITLSGSDPVNLFVGDTYTDDGATALDDIDGNITADIVVGGDIVDTSAAGIYIITYNVSDSVGNPAIEVTRTVNVNECEDGSGDSGVCSLADGSLVRGEGTPEVYLIENGQKRWIVDPHAFTCLGYSWGYISSVSEDELNNCPDGENITAPTGCGSGGGGGGAGYFTIGITVDNLKTNDTTPELTGTINSNDATVTVRIAGNEYSATNNSDGTWILPDNTVSELRIGIYDVSVKASYNQFYLYGWGTDNTTNELTIKSDEEKPSYAVAIDNQKNARPVSGVDEADVVYEFPVEGSITRFMAIYNPDSGIDSATQIGPVRSARPYFARTASEHKSIYAHAGGIPDALYGLSNHEYSVYNLDALVGAGEQYFWRDETRSAPHNLYTSIEKLNNFRDDFELGNGTFTQPWIFSDNPSSIGYDQNVVEVKYANQNYNVKWIYDDADSVYYRQSYENGSYQDYIDINNKHISTTNLAVQYAHTNPFTEMWQMEGAALLCREGKCVNGKWKKDGLDSNVKFYLINNEEFGFKTGKLWINVADATDTSVMPITGVTVENVSMENELKLKINWVNPPDKDLARIVIYRSNIFSPNSWSFVGGDYIAPDTTSIIDNYRLVEGITYYYLLIAADTSGNWSEWSEEASGIPSYNRPITSGIRIDDITWIRNFGATNNTYMDGWKLKFDITVNDPAENQLKFKMSDWTSNSNTIATIGNTKISLADLNSEAGISGATSMGNEYSDMNFLTISDINPSMNKTQASFYVWIKLPANTVAGNYRANYGIQTLTQ